MTRPVFYRPDGRIIAWADPVSGVVVLGDGRQVFARASDRRRKGPDLPDLAGTLAAAGVTRAYLTGGPWPAAWFTYTSADPAGWRPGARGHYTDTDDPRLDLVRGTPAGVERLELRRTLAWGIPADVSPARCRDAWQHLELALVGAWKVKTDVALVLATPTGTGHQLAALAAPPGWDGTQLDGATADLIRRTSPQHRIEVPGACWGGCDTHQTRPELAPGIIHHMDARFAYGALLRGLGTSPAFPMTRAQTWQAMCDRPFSRWRAKITYTVPRGWADPGLFMEAHPDGRHWHAPDLPGYTGTTWADAVEISLATQAGWRVDPIEGLAFTELPTGPLETWGRRLLTSWADLTAISNTRTRITPAVAVDREELAARMIRAIVLRTIGSLHSTGRRTRHVSWPIDVPAEGVSERRDLPDGQVTYTTRQAPTGAAAAWARPEISSQIWARAHTRLAAAPGGTGYLGLDLNKMRVVGMWGDALYIHGQAPHWPDDGHAGRYRLTGATPGAVAAPTDIRGLIQLRDNIRSVSHAS